MKRMLNFATAAMKRKEDEIDDCLTQKEISRPNHRVPGNIDKVHIPVIRMESNDYAYKVIFVNNFSVRLIPL